MNLLQQLHNHLAHHPLSFAEFMQQALYAPGVGYYSSGLAKLGPQGDFTTAPELTPLYGKTLAQQCQQVLSELDLPCIFEFGAGTGQLCVDILGHLHTLSAVPETYFILELSADLRQRQQENIQTKIPHLADKVQWLDRWPEHPFRGVVLANEVLDAMPVHRFLLQEEQIFESFIQLDEQKTLQEYFKPCDNPQLLNYIQNKLPFLSGPYLSEANLFLDDWMKQIAAMLEQGAVFLIDYGFPRHEYYHQDRNQGTLMCHYQHQAHPNPLIHIGSQDITAHVDFTQVAEAADEAGFHVAGYTDQASFLLANGLLHLLNTLDTEAEQFRAKQAIKQLTHPSEMGELFKVIALTKHLDVPLTGFMLRDKRAYL